MTFFIKKYLTETSQNKESVSLLITSLGHCHGTLIMTAVKINKGTCSNMTCLMMFSNKSMLSRSA